MRHPNRRDLLQLGLAGATAGLAAPLARATTQSGPRKLIVIMANGGWDVTYGIDPKLGLPTVQGPEIDEDPDNPDDREAIATYGEIPVVVNPVKRPNVAAFFEAAAQDCLVFNGIDVGTIAHDVARQRMVTGHPTLGHPDLSVIAGSVHGQALPLGSVDMSGLSHIGWLAASAGRIGARSQLKLLVDDSSSLVFADPFAAIDPWGPDAAQADAVEAVLRARAERLRVGRDGDAESATRFDAWDQAFIRAQSLREDGAEVLGQLDLSQPPSLGRQSDLAVQLLQGGLCHCVFLATPQIWDTHSSTAGQHTALDGLFRTLTYLYGELVDRQMLDQTLVMVTSEFARTPLMNADAGKDHSPNASVLLIGGGLGGARLLGGTGDSLEPLGVDLETAHVDPAGSPCSYQSFIAGMLEVLEVDPAEWLPDVAPLHGLLPA